MLKNLLDKIFKKPKAEQNSDLDGEIIQSKESKPLKLNADNWSEEDRSVIQSAAYSITNIEVHSGHVEHGYALKFVATSAQCPRCKAKTQQYYTNFIYATNVAPRIMFAPAGYFCQNCPTVIIDEKMIQSGIIGNFIFQGVIGIEDDPKQKPSIFTTWNGKAAVYVIDENDIPQCIATILPRTTQKAKNKNREKNRLAKLSRRRNQKRK